MEYGIPIWKYWDSPGFCLFCLVFKIAFSSYKMNSRDSRDFHGGRLIKNLPCNAGDMGLIPGWGTKIPHASGQLSSRTTTRQPQQNKAVAKTRKAHVQQWEVHVPQWSACTLQLRPSTVKIRGFPCGSAGEKSTCNVGDLGLISRLERSPGEGNGYPLQCSCILVWRIPWAV